MLYSITFFLEHQLFSALDLTRWQNAATEENPKIKYLGRAEICGFLPGTSCAETVPGSREKVSVQPNAAASSRGTLLEICTEQQMHVK